MRELMERMAARISELEERIAVLEAHERSLTWGLATEDLALIDAGSAAATEQDWIEVTVGGNIGYHHIFAAK